MLAGMIMMRKLTKKKKQKKREKRRTGKREHNYIKLGP